MGGFNLMAVPKIKCVGCGAALGKVGSCTNEACASFGLNFNKSAEAQEPRALTDYLKAPDDAQTDIELNTIPINKDCFEQPPSDILDLENELRQNYVVGYDSSDSVDATVYAFRALEERENILQEAMRITTGDRNKDYGSPAEDFGRVAKLWSAILGVNITPMQAVMCMVLLKVSRQTNKNKRDNLVDIAGYARVAEMLGE
jgi:hypothetical protein